MGEKSWEVGVKVNERELEASLYKEIDKDLAGEIKVGYDFQNKKLKAKGLIDVKNSIKMGISYDGNERRIFLFPYANLKKYLLAGIFSTSSLLTYQVLSIFKISPYDSLLSLGIGAILTYIGKKLLDRLEKGFTF